MFLGLLLSIIGLLSCSSHLSVWAFLVLSSLCTLGLLKFYLPAGHLVLIFIPSVTGGLLFLAGSVLVSDFTFVLEVGLFLKLGLVPFHWWLVKVLPCLRGLFLWVLLCLSKVGPLFLLSSLSSSLAA